MALKARQNAYAPYSHFPVGACLRAEDNNLYCGCNIENASYGLSLCAEASALAALINSGNKTIKEILVVADALCCTPCGSCRQRLYEFAKPNTVVYICNLDKNILKLTMGDLLPHPFTARCLEKK